MNHRPDWDAAIRKAKRRVSSCFISQYGWTFVTLGENDSCKRTEQNYSTRQEATRAQIKESARVAAYLLGYALDCWLGLTNGTQEPDDITRWLTLLQNKEFERRISEIEQMDCNNGL